MKTVSAHPFPAFLKVIGLIFAALFLIAGCSSHSLPSAELDPHLQLAFTTQPPNPRQLDLVHFIVQARNAHGKLISGAAVRLKMVMPGMDMGPDTVVLQPDSAGTYQGTGRFTMPGHWLVFVTAVHGRDKAVQSFPIQVH